jgi:hypothetical protein
MRDGGAREELVRWLQRYPPTQILEETAQVLATWPEARPELEKILEQLERAHAQVSPGERMKQLTRHALLSAKGGNTVEAAARVRSVVEAQRQVPVADRRYLVSVLEVLTTPTEQPGAAGIADQIAQGIKAKKSMESSVMTSFQRLQHEGRVDAVRLLNRALTAHESLKDTPSRDTLIGSNYTLAAQANRWGEFVPHAWLKEVREDGTVEVGWALGWFTANDEETAVFYTPDLSRVPPMKPMKVELFYGEKKERLERFAVVEEAAPAGVWRGPLDMSGGMLGVSITTDGRTFLGAPSNVRDGKNLMPAMGERMDKFPVLVWSRQKGGPQGEFWRGVNLGASIEGRSFAEGTIELPSDGSGDLSVTGWMKGGRLTFSIVTPDGRKSGDHTVEGNAAVWTRVFWRLPAGWIGENKGNLGEGSRCVLSLAPGGEYTTFNVSVVPLAVPGG